ncbi:MAG TPA: NAD-dependent epimerase/dehydratase family protein [Xanthobacteraceae bacterium]
MKVLVVGGAGFIGSYVVDYLLGSNLAESVVVYDNFSAGTRAHLRQHKDDRRVTMCANDIYDSAIFAAAEGASLAIHLAANPDIAKALTEPDIDFHQGTALTQIVLEALRKGGCRHLLYASGSGVYGDVGSERVSETFAPMSPISTYGASKLACEALICSYCAMFGLKASAFRFGNVVGGRQTHGVAYDFLKKLRADPSRLEVMGNGHQSKPYIDVADAVEAMFIAYRAQSAAFDAYNVAPDDFTSVREIVGIVLREMGIPDGQCAVSYGELGRGWKGDVPIVRLNSDKIRALGWSNRYTSTEAMRRSVQAMLADADGRPA